ncbi:hypothetical protein CYMTET_50972 [Cymbomonas tetramitiformis]|uniref:Uncharacterized protein n=1 Tax=Cymbomonas tetramitiformis TaxID=36881 RepID=A0AAE0BM69_9CHLO|nr:hypothetical protein CYMTET_50972 [Cymbomonas tetramitiformis]
MRVPGSEFAIQKDQIDRLPMKPSKRKLCFGGKIPRPPCLFLYTGFQQQHIMRDASAVTTGRLAPLVSRGRHRVANRAPSALHARPAKQPSPLSGRHLCSSSAARVTGALNNQSGQQVQSDVPSPLPVGEDSNLALTTPLELDAAVDNDVASQLAGFIASSMLLTLMMEAPALAAQQPKEFFNFNPVCPASDGIFRLGQQTALSLAGDQNVEDYRPLINDVLIRVRTELCVLESFVRETATPFIQEKGISWILPLKETSDTYIAGVVFMVGANFILLGSTKIVAILSIYHDLVLGLPCRLLGRVFALADEDLEVRWDNELSVVMEKQMGEVKVAMKETDKASRESKVAQVNKKYGAQIEDLKTKQDQELANKSTGLGRAQGAIAKFAIPLKIYGGAALQLRKVLEIFDTFCSRYFVTFTVGYIVVKTAHYVLFPEFPCDSLDIC